MKLLIKLPFVVMFFVIAFAVSITPVLAGERSCNDTATALELASKLRRLEILEPVQCKLQNIVEVRNYVKKKLHDSGISGHAQYEEIILKMLGFVPEDYNYNEGLIQIYTSQLAGYYDPENKYYAMADWLPANTQTPITIHELTHALQDQHFNLSRLVEDKDLTTDLLLARIALAEGDAAAVMYDYMNKKRGAPSLAEQGSVSGITIANMIGFMMMANSNNVPNALQLMMAYPYLSGLTFVHLLLLQNGYQAVDNAYFNLPNSTREILHPEKYIARVRDGLEQPFAPEFGIAVPRLLKKKYNTPSIFSDTLGEFMISSLLSNYLSSLIASEASAGWRYDRLDLYQLQDEPQHFLLAWIIENETEADANVLFNTMVKAFSERFYQSTRKDDGALYFKNNANNMLGYVARDGKYRVRVEVSN